MMIQSVLNVLNNGARIWKQEEGFGRRFDLLATYGKLMVKYLLFYRLLKKNKRQETLFGSTIKFFDYDIFFWLFYEIFIKKEYWFAAKTETPTIIDCGSNIGMSILFFKKYYPQAKIIGFEPDRETFAVLKENVAEWNAVAIHNLALSDREGMISFYSDAEGKGKLAMSITKQGEEHGMRCKETKVPTTKLSSYITAQVDFLKLDVEGAETLVLEDLDKNKKLPFIKEAFIEYHYSKENPKNKLSVILGILEKNNLKYCINGDFEFPFEKWKRKAYNVSIYAYS